MSQEPAPPPDVEWVKVSGPDALAPLDRHWIRLLRVALLAAAVLIAWRILAWQEDSYQLAAAGAPAAQTNAGSMVTAPPIPETPVPTAVPVVVISPTPTPTIAPTPTPTAPPTPTPKTHTVRPGEYLSVIAGFYGVSMGAILELNNIPDPDNLPIGQVLLLPPDAEVPAEAELPATYIVQPGETLSTIAVALGVTVEELIAANDIPDPNNIFVGQELNVPGGGS
ncbi:MAG: LysM domain-containing protein [Chloroflexi bacterium]|nr:LysM domain-containing protein [Chloroflexota bacterium]